MTLEKFYKKRDNTLTKEATLQDVVNKMYKLHIRYIVLVDFQNYPIGILTERDILFLYEQNIDFHTTIAYDVATKTLIKAHKEREIEYALNFMVDHNIRRVVIIDTDDKYLGVVEQEEIIFSFEANENKNSLKIYEVLLNESKALSVEKNFSLEYTLTFMKEHNIGSVLVSENGKAVGIFTESDILVLAKDGIDKRRSISCFMHSPIYKISIKSSMKDCIELMREKQIRRLVIEEDDGKEIINYIITTKDILNNLQGNYSKFLEAKLFSQKSTFENLEDLVIEAYDFGKNQVISWANKSAKKKLHVGIDDTLDKIIPKDLLQKSIDSFKENEYYTKEGIEINGRFYRYTASSIEMFGSRVIKILLSDFTDLYVSNKKLLDQVDFMNDSIVEQESMQKEIINQDAIGIGYIDNKGEILFANKYICNLLGYAESELIGKNIEDITYKDDLKKSKKYIEKLLNSSINKDKKTNLEKRYIHKNGSLIWVHVSMSYTKSKDGSIKYIIGFIKDIRDRKITEKRLIQAKAVFDNTNEGIVITDRKMNIQEVNKGFIDILGYEKSEICNKNIKFFTSSYHSKMFYKKMWYEVFKKGYWQGEIWGIRKSGETFPLWLNISTIKDEVGKIINYIGVFSDISSIKKSEEKLEFLAHHDPLTKLPNRLLLTASLEQSIKRAKREKKKIAVIFLDLDKFKEINDAFGHSYGDEVLVTVTKRLKSIMREQDTIGRIGGDEFIVLIEDFEEILDLEPILEKILNVFKKDIIVHGNNFKISASIGVSVYPNDGKNIENLIKNADTAMYEAKDAGRDTYRFYTPEMTQDLFTKMLMKNELERAIKDNEFVLHYQPQVSIVTGKVIGLEALVRWNHPQMGLLYPDKFISIAESTKQIVQIGRIVLHRACSEIKELVKEGIFNGKISVNVSAVQIKQDNFYEAVLSTLKESNLSGEYLELELTESYMMENPRDAISLFKKLKTHGITLSVDDFGTGYSSLSYLKQLPVDKLKIDKSFIVDIPSDSDDMAITSTIIAMSKSLGLGVIAEGIETQSQHDFLKQRGCYEGQGYLYSRPCSFKSIKKVLVENKKN